MKKICFVTAARSEYGTLKWIMNDIKMSGVFELQLIATGGHLMKEQGHTIDQIIEDGFQISEIVDVGLDLSSASQIAASMGRMAALFATAFEKLKPDYLVVLGDRYELLPICNTAFVMRIPIIHLSGGDITEGAIDDGIRNAVTMLATYHFPGTAASADNIIRMRGTSSNVWVVGEPGLDAFNREKLMTREALAEIFGLKLSAKWALFTYHAETTRELQYNLDTVNNCVDVLKKMEDYQIMATYSNADFGGNFINEILEDTARERPDKFIVVPSLGQLRYLSFVRQAEFVVGNSSSGIIEAPFLRIPVVNVGDRQKGRYQCNNIVQSESNYESIEKGIAYAVSKRIVETDLGYWGDGHTSERIVKILEILEHEHYDIG